VYTIKETNLSSKNKSTNPRIIIPKIFKNFSALSSNQIIPNNDKREPAQVPAQQQQNIIIFSPMSLFN
jgi:hypothetical protein